MTPLNCLVALLLLCIGSPVWSAEDWPVARGNISGTAVAKSAVPKKPELLWTYEAKDSAFEVTPVVASGVAYLGDADGRFHAVRVSDGSKVWAVDFKDAGFVSAAAVRSDRVYLGDYDGVVRCLATKDGAKQWEFDAETEVYAGPVLHGDDLLVTTEGGVLYAINTKSGEEHWRFTIDAPLRCSPTIVGGRILLAGCDSKLHAVDAKTGKENEKESVEFGAATGNTAAARAGRAFFGNEGGAFLAVDVKQKLEIAWTFNDPRRTSGIRTAAAVTDKVVVFATQSKTVFALNTKNKDILWRTPIRGRIEASPVIAGNKVVVATNRGRLILLDLKDGKQLWDYDAGDSFIAAPAVVDGRVLIANDNGKLYCFGEKVVGKQE